MQTLAHRRSLGIGGVLLLLASLFMVIAGPAGAIPQSNPSFPTVSCGGEWHWLHNQTSATSGTLTAVFQNAGTIVVNNSASPSGNLHYYINLSSGDTLLSAGDNVDGGMLLLSHYPTCPTTTTAAPTTTTTAAPTTTTTVQQSTTTTAAPTTTTTAAAVDYYDGGSDDYYDGGSDDYDHGSAVDYYDGCSDDDHDRCSNHYNYWSDHYNDRSDHHNHGRDADHDDCCTDDHGCSDHHFNGGRGRGRDPGVGPGCCTGDASHLAVHRNFDHLDGSCRSRIGSDGVAAAGGVTWQ